MSTNFPVKKSNDILYAAEINAIHRAINNLELAIGLTAGTTLASIPASQLASGIPGEKIDPLSTLTVDGLTGNSSFSLNGWGRIGAATELGASGYLEIIDHTAPLPRTVVTLGRLSSTDYGILARNTDNDTTFHIDRHGQVTVRGRIFSAPGSVLGGTLNVDGGQILGRVTLGGPDGITLDGASNRITLGHDGELSAGNVTLSAHSGILINQGSINIGFGRFTVSEDGELIAHGATIFGRIYATGGSIGGIDIDEDGIHAGGSGSDTSGYALTPDGYLFARKGSFTGEIHAQSGTLGNLTVIGSIQAGYTTISSAGIDIQSGSINLGNGRFIVEPDGSMTASQATIVGQIT